MAADGSGAPRRVAVIGGGISGMGAALGLSPWHRVTLFEASPRLGGHAHTVMGGKHGSQPVDIGFIVFNRANYPQLTRLFTELGVKVAPSAMTFGVSIGGGRVEYALQDLNALFAQRRNLGRPAYWRMLRDVLSFNARAHEYAQDDSLTVRDMLAALGSSDWFRDYYLLPFSGAIWSTPVREVLDFPAAAMVRFFQNHNLLDVKGQHQWYTVEGGSQEYVARLEQVLVRRNAEIRKRAQVDAVLREGGGVRIKTAGGTWEHFDEVVFATHADDTIRMIADPGEEELASVGRISYQPNEVVLHSDAALMPRRRRAWASWVYTEGREGPGERIGLTYWMNSLQPIPMDDPLFVSLNSDRAIDPAKVHHAATFRHPVYTTETLRAQQAVRAINGARNTWFCGAWLKNGFHEDGLSTGLEAAARIGGAVPADRSVA
ncbi:NAD(P)/FAD-dependent oxidoreductase [Mangrovicoccus sp. HB161399]|uniref:NAD(P)/FAD-dependent oxidoreductase n=1 Tax=Mangrovicoccus sp. HB161399 TaxID=2720392 RepID=UPI0015538255|nr:FAD-dependent oxidoreductase [Mangrovicoccus sp. HB161399]